MLRQKSLRSTIEQSNIALQHACNKKNPSFEHIKKLCEKLSVNCFYPTDLTLRFCDNALELALIRGHFQIVEYFLEHPRFQKELHSLTKNKSPSPENILFLLLKKNQAALAKKLLAHITTAISSTRCFEACLEMNVFDTDLINALFNNNPKIIATKNKETIPLFLIALKKEKFGLAEAFFKYEAVQQQIRGYTESNMLEMRKALELLDQHHQNTFIEHLKKTIPSLKEIHKKTLLELTIEKYPENLDLIMAIYHQHPDLPCIEKLFFSFISHNQYEMACLLLNKCPDLQASRKKIETSLVSQLDHDNYLTAIKENILPGVPLSDGALLVNAARLKRYDAVEYLLSQWSSNNEEEKHEKPSHFLSKCSPDELANTLVYLTQQNHFGLAIKLIHQNPDINQSTLKPMMTRDKISDFLNSLQPQDITANHLTIVLKSYLADPRKKNSISQLFISSVNLPKINTLNKIIHLTHDHATIQMAGPEFNYFILSEKVEKSLLKKIIRTFYSLKEWEGLRKAVTQCTAFSKESPINMQITQDNCQQLTEKTLAKTV